MTKAQKRKAIHGVANDVALGHTHYTCIALSYASGSARLDAEYKDLFGYDNIMRIQICHTNPAGRCYEVDYEVDYEALRQHRLMLLAFFAEVGLNEKV